MRFLIPALFLLAACTPTEAPSDAANDAPGDPAMLASAALAEGQWHSNADESNFSAGYGGGPGQYHLSVMCDHGSGGGFLMNTIDLPAEHGDTLTIITDTATITLPGLYTPTGDVPNMSADLTTPEGKRAAQALSATQARVAVKVGDHVAVIPWDQSLATTLAGCL
ncbi:MAG: hypothetical protein AB7T59_06875 [Hyphomonadaceae bacterium]